MVNFTRTGLVMLVLLITACGSVEKRKTLAQGIATQGKLIAAPRTVTGGLPVVSKARIGNPGQPARVYIEGDGLAFLSRSKRSPDPTPTNPVALRMAAADNAANVIWIARPCQYTRDMPGHTQCHPRYWTTGRFAPETVEAVNKELERLKRTHNIPSFEIVGFSGGGAIAGILAARRNDVTCLRSVAGNMDHDAFTAHHRTPPLTESLNAADYPARLSIVPQYHYVGAKDTVVPGSVVQSYRDRINPQSAFTIETIPGVSHEKGWVELWPSLLQRPCVQSPETPIIQRRSGRAPERYERRNLP